MEYHQNYYYEYFVLEKKNYGKIDESEPDYRSIKIEELRLICNTFNSFLRRNLTTSSLYVLV